MFGFLKKNKPHLRVRHTVTGMPLSGVDVRTGEAWEERGIKWSCMICGDLRPDENISVIAIESMWELGVRTRKNVRYCNDREICIELAVDTGLRG